MMNLPTALSRRVAEMGLGTPTPIQAQAIPHALNGRDVMGLAQTGTGKTAAFGIPLIARLMEEGARALLHQSCDQRDTKGRCLTGAGLRQPHHVTAVQRVGYRLSLDRRRRAQPHFSHAPRQGRGQVHHIKITHGSQ